MYQKLRLGLLFEIPAMEFGLQLETFVGLMVWNAFYQKNYQCFD